MILIPVKSLSTAKQRLASVLSQPARTELAQAMLQDVLQSVCDFGGDDAALVTSDLFAIDLAVSHGVEIIRDDANVSETDAIAMATSVCEARGIERTLVIPADIPLVTASDLEDIFRNAPSAGSVLVSARDGRGTNAVLRRPAALFPLRFGNYSFVPHLAAARATGKPCVTLSLAGIGLDLDTPEDLSQLALASGNRRAQVLARNFLATVHLEQAVVHNDSTTAHSQ